MTSSPCKGCEHRFPDCHSECERYLEYSKMRAKMIEANAKDRDYMAAHSEQVLKAMRKREKERRR